MTEETKLDDTSAETAGRSRGRPTIAEIEAREKAIKEREDDLAIREREAQLAAAEANAALREAELAKAEAIAAASKISPARSGTPRSADVRSDTVTQPLRRRRYHSGEMPNEFHIPPDQIPDGTSYQWNNYTVFGMQNPSADAHMQMQGWVPVPAERHPHLVPVGYTGPIVVKGQILMERPIELTQEALQEDYNRAVGEVRRKEEQLYGTPQGQLPRSRANGSNEFINVKRDVEPGVPVKPNYTYEGDGMPIE